MNKSDLTKEQATRLYTSLAKKSYRRIESASRLLRNKDDFSFISGDYSFEKHGEDISYDGYVVKSLNGEYLAISVSKKVSESKISIALNRGKTGFDLSTGQRYDRRLCQVNYNYDGNQIEIVSVKDEEDLNKEEQEQAVKTSERVKQLSRESKKEDIN